ncbi:MAG: hypothetical protein QM654_18300 [Dysgonamonadaceae bacterium]
MNELIFKWANDTCGTLPGQTNGHRANSIRPYNGQVIFLMIGAYNDDKMQITGIWGI